MPSLNNSHAPFGFHEIKLSLFNDIKVHFLCDMIKYNKTVDVKNGGGL